MKIPLPKFAFTREIKEALRASVKGELLWDIPMKTRTTIRVGGPADLIVVPCSSGAAAIAEIVQPTLGIKRGRRSFTRPLPQLHRQ